MIYPGMLLGGKRSVILGIVEWRLVQYIPKCSYTYSRVGCQRVKEGIQECPEPNVADLFALYITILLRHS